MPMYASASSARLTWWTAHGEDSIRKYLVNVPQEPEAEAVDEGHFNVTASWGPRFIRAVE